MIVKRLCKIGRGRRAFGTSGWDAGVLIIEVKDWNLSSYKVENGQ